MITFSIDIGLNEKDIEITGKLAEEYFKTQSDLNQIKVKEVHGKWILFEQIKKFVNYNNFDTIYLCSAFIVTEYRKHGLASKSIVKSIKKIIKNRKIKPILFYWAHSDEGKRLAYKISDTIKLELRERID